MKDFLFSWKSNVMIKEPWKMPVFLFSLGILLSIITAIRKSRSKTNKS